MLNGLAIETEQPIPLPLLVAAPVEVTPEDLRARAGVCRLLAGVFVEEPSPEFLSALRAPEALRSLEEAGLRFDADFTGADPAELSDSLSIEYTTLFAASGGFPPVESVRLTGRYQQEPHFAVKEIYKRAGFELQKGRFFVFEDQLGVELSFVAGLLEGCAAALAADDVAQFRWRDRELKRFWVGHLGKWVRGYARLIERAAEHSFYREMARLLGEFAEAEIAALRLRIDDQDKGKLVVPKSEVKVAFNPDEPVCGACPGST
ncbi:MAG: molecular chaperone TorD family protein [Betaproteobacteria bacterium]|nr:molecular chaperone TorD family protein [Betaproteobacteria bacterium]